MANVDIEMLIDSVGKWRIEPPNIIDMPTMGIRTNPYDRWSALINRPTYTSGTSTSLTPLRSNTDDLASKLEELERQILIIQERLDKGVLKEQVSLLDLLKSDTESS